LFQKISDDANSIEEDDKAMIMMSICDIAEEYDNGDDSINLKRQSTLATLIFP
jgi:hypothetical protein